MRVTRPVGSGPGCGGEEADRERLREARERDVVGHVLAERLQERDLDEVDADCVAHEVGHLAAGNPRGDLDDGDAAVGRRDELREGDRVARGRARAPTRRRPARRGAAARAGSTAGRRGSSRRRSRCPEDAGGRESVIERRLADRARSRCRSARRRRRTPRGAPRRSATRRSPRRGRARAPRGSRCGRRRAGRPSRPASGRPGSATVVERGVDVRRRSEGSRTAAAGGLPHASASRIARLCVRRCAVCVPIPGSPSASATAATTGTARSAETVSTPSTPIAARDLDHLRRRP